MLIQRAPRRGVTLVELLVVMAIIGILASLVMPSLQGAREAARRLTCTSNLRQIGLAITSYETSFKRLPAGYVSEATRDGTGPEHAAIDPFTWDAGPGWGWAALILPYMDELPLSKELDTRRPIWDQANRKGITSQLPIYLCPSSSGPRKPFVLVDEAGSELTRYGDPIVMGRSHYVANHGQESCWGDCSSAETSIVFDDIYTFHTKEIRIEGETKHAADGPFFRNSDFGFSAITDGLSNTMFVGEHSSKLSDKSWAGVVPGAFVHPRFATLENGPESAATLTVMHVGPSGGEVDVSGFPIIHPVNFPTYHVCQMYAEHPGGGNVLFGDGSVRFMSDSAHLIVAAELASMNESDIRMSAME